MGDRAELVRAAVAGIVSYLGIHAEARDTAEGIRRWWLSDECERFSDSDVMAALEQLIQHDRVTRMTLSDGTELFAGKGATTETQPRRKGRN